MGRGLECQLLGYLEKTDLINKAISVLRESLTNLAYHLPRDEIPPIKLP